MKSHRHSRILPLISIVIGISTSLIALELLFQFLPVQNTGSWAVADDQFYLNHYQPHSKVRWSAGWNFRYRTEKEANNYGYLNTRNFERTDQPLAVVIGDSYVEALQVRNEEAIHGLLDAAISPRGRIYGIGASGAQLSGYLAYSEFVRDEFEPDALVFVIIMNDFDESFCRYARVLGYTWCFSEKSDGSLEMDVLKHPTRSLLRRIASRSDLLRYLAFNAGIDPSYIRTRLSPGYRDKEAFMANIDASVAPEREVAGRRAIMEFFSRLPQVTGLATNKILMVVDGIREEVYAGTPVSAGTYAGRMRVEFIRQARRHGYELVNMQEVFAQDYSKNSQHFEYPTDRHWNRIAHYLAAQQVANSELFRSVFTESPNLVDRPES